MFNGDGRYDIADFGGVRGKLQLRTKFDEMYSRLEKLKKGNPQGGESEEDIESDFSENLFGSYTPGYMGKKDFDMMYDSLKKGNFDEFIQRYEKRDVFALARSFCDVAHLDFAWAYTNAYAEAKGNDKSNEEASAYAIERGDLRKAFRYRKQEFIDKCKTAYTPEQSELIGIALGPIDKRPSAAEFAKAFAR